MNALTVPQTVEQLMAVISAYRELLEQKYDENEAILKAGLGTNFKLSKTHGKMPKNTKTIDMKKIKRGTEQIKEWSIPTEADFSINCFRFFTS